MKGRKAVAVEITAEEKASLEKLVRTQTALQRDVTRARIILKAAQGMSDIAIAKSLEIEEKTVRKWKKRFLKDRLKGLQDKPRTGAPSAFSPSGQTPVH